VVRIRSSSPKLQLRAILVQADYAPVVELDIGASKSDICAVRVVTISERAGNSSLQPAG
jgi:hypothetical protein